MANMLIFYEDLNLSKMRVTLQWNKACLCGCLTVLFVKLLEFSLRIL